MAYELLTGSTLFAGDSLPEIFAAHLGHDGDPAALLWLRQNPRHAPLAELLSAGLARDPSRRLGIKDMRGRLGDLGRERLAAASWPIRP